MANNTALQRLTQVITLEFDTRAATALHIGAAESSISIGGVDNPVIRDPLSNRPYIPGSSLKGKARSLLERRHGLDQNQSIGQVYIHVCKSETEYSSCPVCRLFGIPAPSGGDRWFCLTRLRVSDAFLSDDSAAALDSASLDLPYTEVKTEAAIDRITSAASPRNMERVPAGAIFGPTRVSLMLYEGDDSTLLRTLVEGLELVQADYLGGSGSRGSGRVAFESFRINRLAFPASGDTGRSAYPDTLSDIAALIAALPAIDGWLKGE
jgi:CRISPR-associated protein Csm3